MKLALFAVTLFLGSCGVSVNPAALKTQKTYPSLTLTGANGEELEAYGASDVPPQLYVSVGSDEVLLARDQAAMLATHIEAWLSRNKGPSRGSDDPRDVHTLKGKVGEVFYGAEVPASIEDTTIAGDQGELRLWVEMETPTMFRAKTGPDGIVMEPAVAALVAKTIGEWAASTTEHSR